MLVPLFDAVAYRDLLEIRGWADELARVFLADPTFTLAKARCWASPPKRRTTAATTRRAGGSPAKDLERITGRR